jgi:hypothetical protein
MSQMRSLAKPNDLPQMQVDYSEVDWMKENGRRGKLQSEKLQKREIRCVNEVEV